MILKNRKRSKQRSKKRRRIRVVREKILQSVFSLEGIRKAELNHGSANGQRNMKTKKKENQRNRIMFSK